EGSPAADGDARHAAGRVRFAVPRRGSRLVGDAPESPRARAGRLARRLAYVLLSRMEGGAQWILAAIPAGYRRARDGKDLDCPPGRRQSDRRVVYLDAGANRRWRDLAPGGLGLGHRRLAPAARLPEGV